MDAKVEVQLADAVSEQGTGQPQTASLRDARRSFERRYIMAVLEQHHWRVGATARALGLQRPNLYRKARQLSITLKPAPDTTTPAG